MACPPAHVGTDPATVPPNRPDSLPGCAGRPADGACRRTALHRPPASVPVCVLPDAAPVRTESGPAAPLSQSATALESLIPKAVRNWVIIKQSVVPNAQ